jgi:hypothetical protein
MKIKFLIAIAFYLGIIRYAQAQTVSILSFEGTKESICIISNHEKDKLAIWHKRDTIHIPEILNIDSITVFNKCLLTIRYSINPGSDMHEQRTLILGISHDKLYQLLHITSLFDEKFIDFRKTPPTPDSPDESSHYETGLILTGNNIQNYRLQVKIHDEKKVKDAPRTNYNRNSVVSLSFDVRQNIFYSSRKKISKNFKFYDPKKQKETKKYIKGTFPSAKLGQSEYYYIKGEWYEKNIYDDLSKYSYRQ